MSRRSPAGRSFFPAPGSDWDIRLREIIPSVLTGITLLMAGAWLLSMGGGS